MRRFYDGSGSNIVVFCCSLYYPSWPVTAREYVNRLGYQVYFVIQTLFLNSDAVSQNDVAPMHTAGTVLSWFEEHGGERNIFLGQHNYQI
jgi:hypothetical protein